MNSIESIVETLIVSYYYQLKSSRVDVPKFYDPEAKIYRVLPQNQQLSTVPLTPESVFPIVEPGSEINIIDYHYVQNENGFELTIFGNFVQSQGEPQIFNHIFTVEGKSQPYTIVSDKFFSFPISKIAAKGEAEYVISRTSSRPVQTSNSKFAEYRPSK